MGISTSTAKLLAEARLVGTVFGDTITIGRQSLTVPRPEIDALARRLGVAQPDWTTFAREGFAEDFFLHHLGARSVASIDASAYQAADRVHDLNRPIPEAWEQQYDTLIDGGAIEHIFDVKQVLTNYMKLIKVGGNIFIITTANNLFGHGLYQFSSELFFRVFSEDNGFVVRSAFMIEHDSIFVERSARQPIYAITDPARLRRRTPIVSAKPIMIFVHAERIAEMELFARVPQQNHYMTEWQQFEDERGAGQNEAATAPHGIGREFNYFKGWEVLRRRWRLRRKNNLRNRKWFRPLDL